MTSEMTPALAGAGGGSPLPGDAAGSATAAPRRRPQLIPSGVLAMLIFGGPTLHYFALALTIGICFGIYSSVFVAAAIAMWLGIKREDLVKTSTRKGEDPNDPNAGATV